MSPSLLLAISILAALFPTPLGKRLEKLCGVLQTQGWTVPVDPQTNKPGPKAEMRLGNLMYLCTLEHWLPGGGPGHAPDLQALISSDGDEDSVILSADVWCQADEAATLDKLAKQVTEAIPAVPPAIAEAIRAAKPRKITVDGVTYEVTPQNIDADACANVAPEDFGPVFMKVDVSIKSAPRKP
jgi:hypothetical protein